MCSRTSHNRLVGALLAIGLVLVVALAPAQAHGDFKHTWEHIKKKISNPGTINAPNNPLEWTRLKNVPGGIADGVDDTAEGECSQGSFITAIDPGGAIVCDEPVVEGGDGDITGVTAGTGLTGGGTSGAVALAVDPTAVQTRLQSSCAAGQMISSVSQAGAVTCAVDDGSGHVIVSQQFEITAGATSGGGSVLCPAGKKAVGGGAEINFGINDGDFTGVAIQESYPNANGWAVVAIETADNPVAWWASSICDLRNDRIVQGAALVLSCMWSADSGGTEVLSLLRCRPDARRCGGSRCR